MMTRDFRSAADMSDAEIDVYLDFCEKALLPNEALEETDSGKMCPRLRICSE